MAISITIPSTQGQVIRFAGGYGEQLGSVQDAIDEANQALGLGDGTAGPESAKLRRLMAYFAVKFAELRPATRGGTLELNPGAAAVGGVITVMRIVL